MEKWKLFLLIGTSVMFVLSFLAVATANHFNKYGNDKGRKNTAVVYIIACVALAVPFYVLGFNGFYELKSEQKCIEELEYMRSIGKNVSGMSCYNNATIERERNQCESARKTLQKNGNDVSDIKC